MASTKMSPKAEEALQKMKDTLLDEYVKIVGIDHPHRLCYGFIKSIDYTNAGWGVKVDLDNGFSCYCFKRTDYQIIP